MAEVNKSPRVSKKLSKLPRMIGKSIKEEAGNVSAILKLMTEESNPSSTTSRSVGQATSKIPSARPSSEKSYVISKRKIPDKPTVSFIETRTNILPLDAILKYRKKFEDGLSLDKNRIVRMTREIPEAWVGVVVALAKSRNEMVQFLVDNEVDYTPSSLTPSTAEIKEKIEAAKLATTNKLSIIAKSIEELLSKSVDFEKIQRTAKAQSLKITTLGTELRKAEALAQEQKLKSDNEKIELENKIQKMAIEASSMKRGLQCRLKEKTEELEKALAAVANVANERNVVQEDCSTPPAPPPLPPAHEDTEEIKIKENVFPGKISPGKQVKLLKNTVRKLESTVDKLSKQNENLRKMLSAATQRIDKEKGHLEEKSVAHTLAKILNEKQKNLEKLVYAVDRIKDHHSASRVQRNQLETRLELLQSRLDGP